ncbi:hypothetical protein COO60DRAFT_306019 [Scenedesmus sp. NREL 46B-D3]|nr:hypothetical protein COO60DRAFT_306019 [Scenedesmus sp. NREL 46B-D3]
MPPAMPWFCSLTAWPATRWCAGLSQQHLSSALCTVRSTTVNTSSRSSTRVCSSCSGSSSSGSTLGGVQHAMYTQLLKLLDYLQLGSSVAGADSILTQWLPRATDVPLRCTRVLRFLYYCSAAEAVQGMLSYQPHGNARARGFSRPSSAAFLITLDEGTAHPSLCVRALALNTDLAGTGLRTAASSQVFSDSNSSVVRNLIALRADVVAAPGPGVTKRSGCWQSGFVRDIKNRAVGVSHPLVGQALQGALLAAVGSTGLGAGFTWATGVGEAVPEAAAAGPQRAKIARVPVWVLWW